MGSNQQQALVTHACSIVREYVSVFVRVRVYARPCRQASPHVEIDCNRYSKVIWHPSPENPLRRARCG